MHIDRYIHTDTHTKPDKHGSRNTQGKDKHRDRNTQRYRHI